MLPRRLSRRFFLEARSALAERAAATAASPGSMTLSYEEWRMLAFARSLAAPMSVPRASCSASRLVLVMVVAPPALLPLRLFLPPLPPRRAATGARGARPHGDGSTPARVLPRGRVQAVHEVLGEIDHVGDG